MVGPLVDVISDGDLTGGWPSPYETQNGLRLVLEVKPVVASPKPRWGQEAPRAFSETLLG
jgi:hypothetical protein